MYIITGVDDTPGCSLVPRTNPVFQRATLKNWVGPGDEATGWSSRLY